MLSRVLPFLWVAAMAGRVIAAPVTVHEPAQPGDFPLVADGRAAPLVVDVDDARVVTIAASCLTEDVGRVTGGKPALLGTAPDGPAVIVGTLDRSRAIKSLVDAGRLDVSDLKGQWESFKIVRVGDALVVVGSDRRGAAYGAFELSRAIGVSPWYWWADVPPKHRDALFISTDAQRVGPPSVKYRGIFLNDEDWGLQPWAAKTFEPEIGDIGPKTYAKIFELLLRLRANYCWPAMHPSTKAFNYYPDNKRVADDYAIVMGSSHAEPMLRNNVGEWPHDQAAKWNAVTNLPGILDYWEARVRENGKYENTWTLGMRGIHDSGMPGGGTIDEKRDRLQQIIAAQRDMLARDVNKDVAAVPQTFCPYKEVLDIYRRGLSLPDDVTIVWPDDNYGHIRQLPDARERKRSGRSGVYYHLSYNGRPHDYLWLESIPPALVWLEMTKAYEFGADRLWVANVGDLKPIEAGMTLFLELAWRADRYGPDAGRAFLRDFYTEQFGAEHGEAVADAKREYFRLCAIRKPETLGWNTVYPNTPVRDGDWSNDQAMRFVEQWHDVARRTDHIASRLSSEQRPAYFELVQYPADAAAAFAQKMIFAEQSRRFAARGDASANTFADQAEAAAKRIDELTRQYNEQLGGKWRFIMSDHPRDLPVFGPPVVARVDAQTEHPTTSPVAAATMPSQPDPVIRIDAIHFSRTTGRDARWTAVKGVGSEGAAIAVFPRLWPHPFRSPDQFHDAPLANYPLELRGDGEYEVTVLALPTQPINAEHELVCGVSFDDDDDEPRIVHFQQSSDERDKTWQQNVLRNNMRGRITVRLGAGHHTLRLWGLDPSVVVQQILIATTERNSTTRPAATAASASSGAAPFHQWAPTPPMGWNSWDCFGTAVTEAQVKANADYMADKLAKHGWQYVVVDIQWYEPQAHGHSYRKDAELAMDEFGRLLPAVNRFPSAADGAGFKSLADYVHGKELKFGVHLLRGIPRQAVERNTPILGTTHHAADIADREHPCAWNPDMWGVDTTKPGAQAYYDSVFRQLADWGVDFVKVDDLSRPYYTHEIDAIRAAIDKTGRKMVLSLSPGATPLDMAEHVSAHANLWRISDDFWDDWKALLEQFDRCRKWAPYAGDGHWPDADMLPLGAVRIDAKNEQDRWTRLTHDEQVTLMTLWCIVRSPLILGGDLPRNDAFTESMMTNDDVLAVDQQSSGARQVSNDDGLIIWVADVPQSRDKYVAAFNTRDAAETPVPVSFAAIELGANCDVSDLWKRQSLGRFQNNFAPILPAHGAALYRLSPGKR